MQSAAVRDGWNAAPTSQLHVTQISSCCWFKDMVDFHKNVTPSHYSHQGHIILLSCSWYVKFSPAKVSDISIWAPAAPHWDSFQILRSLTCNSKLYVVYTRSTTGSHIFFGAVGFTEFLWILSKRLQRPVLARTSEGRQLGPLQSTWSFIHMVLITRTASKSVTCIKLYKLLVLKHRPLSGASFPFPNALHNLF